MYCDADNNDEGDDKIPPKLTNKKKKPKNKPFEGHGIGYHQGKTVVIKLLPTAETYHIINKPAFPMFDYFSKTPQVLPPKKIDSFSSGKRIAETYKPYTYAGDYDTQARREVQDLNSVKTINSSTEDNPKVIANVTKGEDVEKDEQDNPENEKAIHQGSAETTDDELSDAFKRLAKILKTHVYPTHLPDLKAYKVNTDYSEFENPKKVPKIAFDFITIPKKEIIDFRRSSDSKYIKSLYTNGPDSLNRDIHGETIQPAKPTKIINGLIPTESKEIKNEENKNEKVEKIHNQNLWESPHAKLVQNPKEMYEIVTLQKSDVVPKEAEAAYRTNYPLKIHKVILNGSIELKEPKYADYENLKDRNNYSGLYLPYTDENDEITQRKYTLFGDSVPTYGDWYQKDYLKRNPVDYDRPSFTRTYILPDSKSDIRIYDISESSEHDPSYESEYTGSLSPQTQQAYTLYGEPVPLTQNWYKVNSQKLIEYPYKHYEPHENSESHEDDT